jgi:Amiloride-sensitive sodium channel
VPFFQSENIQQCKKVSCPQLCEQQVYLVEETQSQGDVVGGYAWSGVYVYFGEIKYTDVSQEKLLNLASFVASLGGVFGVWTGMSVVTIVQALALCIEHMLNKCRRPAAWKNVKKAVNNSGYLGRPDWHGLLDFYLAKSWGWRLFWVIIIMGCCATFTFYCNDAYQTFVYNNTATGLSIRPTKSAPLPFIRFCHKDGHFNLTFIHQILKSLNMSNNETTSSYFYHILAIYSKVADHAVHQPGVIANGIPMFMKLFGKNSIHRLNLLDFLVNSSYSCQQTFASCSFNSQPFDCCANVHTYFMPIGFCHQLDPLKGAVQQLAGREGGASLHVKLHREEFLRADALLFGNRSYDSSLLVTFSESERLNLFDEIIYISPGTRNNIRLQMEEFEFVPGYEKKCVEVPPSLHVLDEQYSEELCYTECAYNVTRQSCGCDLPIYYDGKNISLGVYCSPFDLAAWVSKVTMSGISEGSEQTIVI